MKKILLLLAMSGTAAYSQNIQLQWSTDSTLLTPESVLATSKVLYVSQVDGAGWDADGKGGIALVDHQGKILNRDWVTGLHAPKGMAIIGKILYVADLKDLVSIELSTGKVLKRLHIEEAKGLNDVSADPSGTLYISDTAGGKIWKVKNDKAEVLLENMKDANGVKWHKNVLYITANNAFLAYNPSTKDVKKICELEKGGDGIEPYKDGFFVTSWLGYLYHVDKNGKRVTLRETHQTNKFKTADIGLLKDILYIPTFFGNTVEAWKIK